MKTKTLGSLQQIIIDTLWQSGKPLKPAQVLEKLGNGYAYTTIMTILKRMVDQKILKRQLKGRVYYYSPVLNKEKFVKNNLNNIYQELFNSYGQIAISQFVDVLKNNKEDMEALKEYLDSQK